MNEIQKISQNSITLSGILILLGANYFYAFFKVFNINYYAYANTSEIIFSFLSIITPLLIYITIFLIFKYDTHIKKWNFIKGINKLKLTKSKFLNSTIKISILHYNSTFNSCFLHVILCACFNLFTCTDRICI